MDSNCGCTKKISAILIALIIIVGLFVGNVLVLKKIIDDSSDKVINVINNSKYEVYGSKENYEKALIIERYKNESFFNNKTKDEIRDLISKQKAATDASQKAEKNVSGNISGQLKDFIGNKQFVYGKKDAEISIYEFGDLLCPYCEQLHKTGLVEQAVKNNKDLVNYVFKIFPVHKESFKQSEAALCFGEIKGGDSYYKFIDEIFNKGVSSYEDNDIFKFASESGISKDKISSCIDSGKYKADLKKNIADGSNIFSVTGTPTIVVVNNKTGNWEKLISRSGDELQKIITKLKNEK